MTPVYSGGLVYEYTEEGAGYGLVNINGNSVSPKPDFTALMNALKNTPAPSGDGDYKPNGSPSECPTESSTWEVKDFQGEQLPAIPSGAVKYMKSGAGKGPGLSGSGSQDAGGASTGTATPGSGSVKGADSSSSAGAASSVHIGELGITPFVCTGAVLLSTLLGMLMV